MINSILSVPVLVLNANYEPLNVCTTKRALGLVISDRASLILNGRGIIHTVTSTFPCPSIIRLIVMIKRPRPQIKLSKQEIFRRDNFTCQYCGGRGVTLTLDHQVPRRMGGKHSWDNLVTACTSCNHKKGGRTPKQASMRLDKRPFAPKATANYIFGRYLKHNQEWGEYIKGW
ncbi:MAG: HNH endonuclease [Chloroflexi bacterium]|nr:HNH endonuclease [Chloroflexota bacterium]